MYIFLFQKHGTELPGAASFAAPLRSDLAEVSGMGGRDQLESEIGFDWNYRPVALEYPCKAAYA